MGGAAGSVETEAERGRPCRIHPPCCGLTSENRRLPKPRHGTPSSFASAAAETNHHHSGSPNRRLGRLSGASACRLYEEGRVALSSTSKGLTTALEMVQCVRADLLVEEGPRDLLCLVAGEDDD